MGAWALIGMFELLFKDLGFLLCFIVDKSCCLVFGQVRYYGGYFCVFRVFFYRVLSGFMTDFEW